MTQMYTTKASSFFNCLVALAVLTVVHSPALCGVVLAPGDPAPPIALSNDQASYTPTVAAASALLKWSPCGIIL
jgi:hypothetical protein